MSVSSRIAQTISSYFTQQENTMKNSNSYLNTFAALLTVVLLLNYSSEIHATMIGPGAGLAGATSADSGTPGRTNIELGFVNLAAGDYNVLDFEFNAVNTVGTVQPFLATVTTASPRQFTPFWVGPTYAPGATGFNTDTYLGGEQFALSVASDVYVGFAMSDFAVGFAGGGATDHNGAPALTPIVNVEFPTFSNKDLVRTYAFAVNVEFIPEVPEPSSFLLLSLGLLGLTRLRRRRR